MTASVKHLFENRRAARMRASADAELLRKRWFGICKKHLPHQPENSIWRFNRRSREEDPSQGWKLHVSATIFDACEMFEKIAPLLVSQNVQFKAPHSLDELHKINCGLYYGYWQVGKFVTIYPPTEQIAKDLAERIHELTCDFDVPAIPFDKRYLPDSCVFYRYGGFRTTEMKSSTGEVLPAVKDSSGELFYDDRFNPVPDWISDPFQTRPQNIEGNGGGAAQETPLTKTYRVFRAISQRGKGGTYQAFDLGVDPPRFCVVKEGRRYGEVGWDGQDGYTLVKNERDALTSLGENCRAVTPRIYSSFEVEGNFYLAMEYVEGESLNGLMKIRRRRFSVRQTIELAIKIAGILDAIHEAGWAWTDCKPANLIVTPDGVLRPIDFEGAHPINEFASFQWKTQGFSKPRNHATEVVSHAVADDLYSLGAVVYFLLTGRLYEPNAPQTIKRLRRNVPARLRKIVEELLLLNSETGQHFTALRAKEAFEEFLVSMKSKH